MTEIKNNLLQHNLKSFHIIYKDKHKLKSKNNNIKLVQYFCLNQHRSHGPIFDISKNYTNFYVMGIQNFDPKFGMKVSIYLTQNKKKSEFFSLVSL